MYFIKQMQITRVDAQKQSKKMKTANAGNKAIIEILL